MLIFTMFISRSSLYVTVVTYINLSFLYKTLFTYVIFNQVYFLVFQLLKKQLNQITSVKDELEERFTKMNEKYNEVLNKNEVLYLYNMM